MFVYLKLFTSDLRSYFKHCVLAPSAPPYLYYMKMNYSLHRIFQNRLFIFHMNKPVSFSDGVARM